MFVLSLTVTTALALLLAETGSATADEAVTTFVDLPSSMVRAVIVALAELVLPMVSRSNVTTPLANAKLPCDAVAEMKDNAEGSGSESTTVFAEEGPLLVTVMVKVVLLETNMVVGAAL